MDIHRRNTRLFSGIRFGGVLFFAGLLFALGLLIAPLQATAQTPTDRSPTPTEQLDAGEEPEVRPVKSADEVLMGESGLLGESEVLTWVELGEDGNLWQSALRFRRPR